MKSPFRPTGFAFRLLGFLRQDVGSCLLFFACGLILRGIPELLVSGYPVGYETITYYAPPMMTFAGRSIADVFGEFFRAGPLFYVLMWLAVNLTGAHPFVILKVVGPLLYGILLVSFFGFLKRGLRLEWKLSFIATLLLAFEVAALRESWDRLRNILALIFVFVALTAFKSDNKYTLSAVCIFATLAALSREYVAFIMLVAISGALVLQKKNKAKSLLALLPAISIFMAIFYQSWLGWSLGPGGQYAHGSYLWVVQDVFSIFIVCYLPLLVFVVKGFEYDRLLNPMLGWLLLGSFSAIVSPWFAVAGYQRWLILLVFPFSIYAVKGFERFRLFEKGNFKNLVAVVSIFLIIGGAYSTGVFSHVGFMPNSYVAINLVQSSIAWNQTDDVIGCLLWLNNHAARNSSLLAEERFYGWTLIYFERANGDVKVVAYGPNSLPTEALRLELSEGFTQIYLIWFTDESLKDFKAVYSQNSISIFQYEP